MTMALARWPCRNKMKATEKWLDVPPADLLLAGILLRPSYIRVSISVLFPVKNGLTRHDNDRSLYILAQLQVSAHFADDLLLAYAR